MNPLLPLNEYVPDGEPHVFGNRLYLYGSHDIENGTRFCMDDYRFYSSSINDLTKWSFRDKSYRKIDDPRSKKERLVDFYAPDCVLGNDGKYYLYYFVAGPNATPFGPLSVAISDNPDGPFTYLHDIVDKTGEPVLDFLTNDPAVINDEGHIYLYYGWGLGRDFRNKFFKPLYDFVLSKLTNRSLKVIRNADPSVLSCAVVELEEDMYTVKERPISVLDSKTSANKKSELYHHPFYEAPSIRKIKDSYYLIYSSGVHGELCFATSKHPNKGFRYGGVIISANDMGYKGNKKPLAFTDTNHGSIELINGNYYVFYHRLTRNSNFSRQACAEKIEIMEDGSIPQVEITTSGIEGYLKAEGKYSSCIACNFFNRYKNKIGKNIHTVSGNSGNYFVSNIRNNGIIGFKYFKFEKPVELLLTVRGNKGLLKIFTDYDSKEIASIQITESSSFQEYGCKINEKGIKGLYIEYIGKGKVDIKDIEFK